MSVLSLQGFRRTGRFVADASDPRADVPAYTRHEDEPPPAQPAFVYEDRVAIGIVTGDWPIGVQREGTFHLRLGNQEWVSRDLADLESRLYAWWLSGSSRLAYGLSEYPNFEVVDTGGGGTAWRHPLGDHGEFLVTDVDGACAEPEGDGSWLCGSYPIVGDAAGAELVELAAPDEVLAWVREKLGV